MVLEAVYEQDFLPCSFGFRPGRSAHQALQSLHTAIMSQGLRWVVDIDIVKYFDSIPHSQLRDFLDRRVTDGVIRRMIDKWLKAGVLEDGLLRHATEGSPQGGVISPCLSNIFLHHVLDEWFEIEVRPRLTGRCTLVRFADDAVMAFEEFLDAKRVLGVLGKRFARYGVSLHVAGYNYNSDWTPCMGLSLSRSFRRAARLSSFVGFFVRSESPFLHPDCHSGKPPRPGAVKAGRLFGDHLQGLVRARLHHRMQSGWVSRRRSEGARVRARIYRATTLYSVGPRTRP